MLRHEFENILMKEHGFTNSKVSAINDKMYKLIEYVYTWHPLISQTDGKRQVAYLYANFGIGIFEEMEEKASNAQDLEDSIKDAQEAINECREQLRKLKEGGNYDD